MKKPDNVPLQSKSSKDYPVKKQPENTQSQAMLCNASGVFTRR